MDAPDIYAEGGKPPTIRTEIWALPDYYSPGPYERRTDPSVKTRRKIATLYDTQDIVSAVRQHVKAPGAYYAAAFIGRDMAVSDVFHVQLKGQALEISSGDGAAPVQAAEQPTAQPQPAVPQPAPPPYTQPAPYPPPHYGGTTEAVSTARELVDLAKALQQPAPPVVDPKQIIAEVVAQLKTAAPVEQPKSLTEQLQELRANQDLLTQLTGGTKPEPPAPPSFLEALKEARETHEELTGLFGGDREQSGFGKVVSLAKEVVGVGREVLQEPVVKGWLFQTFMGGQAAAGPIPPVGPGQPLQNGAHGPDAPHGGGAAAPQAPAPSSEAASRQVLNNLIADLKRGKRVGRAADEIEALLKAFPELEEQFTGLLNMPPADVLSLLSVPAGEVLTEYVGAEEWIEELAAELRGGESEDDEQLDETEGVDIVQMVQSARP